MLVTPIESIGDLDEAAYQLNDVLLTSYHDSCIHKTRLCKRKVPWWNHQLAKLRKQVRKLFNHAKRTKSWDKYRSALTEYNLELRRSKRATCRKCCENIADLPVAARTHKALVKDHAYCVGLLKNLMALTRRTVWTLSKPYLRSIFQVRPPMYNTCTRT